MSLAKVAAEYAASFETRTRLDGSKFVCHRADAPEWAQGVTQAAHCGMMPDDTRYSMIEEVASAMTEALDCDEDLDDAQHERIDGLIDVYNADRARWLASHLERAFYVDDAQHEGLISPEMDEYDRLACGQYMEYCEIWNIVTRELAELVDDEDEGEE